MSQNEKPDSIQVTVTFPLAGAPFHGTYSPTTPVSLVRAAAMKDFNISEDPSSVYYLTHEGERLSDDRQLGEIAGHAHGLKLRLVKDLVQG